MDSQSLDLSAGFKYGAVDFTGDTKIQEDLDPSLGVLHLFEGTFVGTGFNAIFRPNNTPSTTNFPNIPSPAPPQEPNEAVLELNLTTETHSFSRPLGSIPNRGFDRQSDIFLNGVTYLQTVNDVSNPNTGKGDGQAVGIHAETGFWINVPATGTNPVEGNTLVRLASIPHGTTVNAKGAPPTVITGAPKIPPRSITPYEVTPGDLPPQQSEHASKIDSARLPQDLTLFIEQGSITQDILDNPASILTNINKQLNIVETLELSVSTDPTSPGFGGGTSNIAFLMGQDPKVGPNANTIRMDATYWIETVQAEITIERYEPENKDTPLLIKPNFKATNASVPPLPIFSVLPPHVITKAMAITVRYPQIQYAQTVLLDFHNLLWPHVSVATLVPAAPIEVPASAFGRVRSGGCITQ